MSATAARLPKPPPLRQPPAAELQARSSATTARKKTHSRVKSFINLLMILTCLILIVDFWKPAIKAYTLHVQKHTVSEETPSRDERSAATPPAVIKKQLKNKEISYQELLTKHRYLDLISRELRKVDHMAEKQTKLRIKEDGIMTTLEENLVSVDKLKRNGRQRKCYLGQRLEKM
ncbi:Fibrous Sheath-Interacting Protein 2 [Manis pentadactyla]|nr:Fibrous Sheath-Interacting Protein 2 [Manis pentadactyla]